MKCSFRHLAMQQLKLENAGMNGRACQTVLAVQEVRLFFTKPQNIQLCSTISSHIDKKLYRTQAVEFLKTEHIFWKNQT